MSNKLPKRRAEWTGRESASAPPGTAPQKSAVERSGGAPRGIAERIVWRPTGELKPFPGNPRRHPESQIASLMKSIERVWTNPILIDETGTILAGHCRLEAAIRLGMKEVPTITLRGLTDSEKRLIVIADNRLPEKAVWDFELLRGHFHELIEVNADVELSGFSTGEVDLLIDGKSTSTGNDPADDVSNIAIEEPAVTRVGDIWEIGRHRLICGDALDEAVFERLMRGELAQMVVTDPPYNVRLQGNAVGRGKVRHREFVMGSGELSQSEFISFLAAFIRLVIAYSVNGSIHYVFMDWRHLPELFQAALPLYHEWKNLLVWNKDNAGLGTFYRSKHEHIAAFKNGSADHINNFKLGAEGRYRANVLDCPSVNSLHPARKGDLADHPTVKPTALFADLMRDCSRRNGIILDPFCGSGTTILAAERTGRTARAIELDPLYVDIAIRRCAKVAGLSARLAGSGLTFSEVKTMRIGPAQDPTPVRKPKTNRRAT